MFERDWYFCNITKSRWFLKRLSRKNVPSNHFLKFSKGLVFSCENCKIFTKNFFDRKPPVASVDLLFWTKNSVGWFLLKRLVLGHSTRYLHTISRNHSNTLLLMDLQKPKTCTKWTTAAKVICSDIRILIV